MLRRAAAARACTHHRRLKHSGGHKSACDQALRPATSGGAAAARSEADRCGRNEDETRGGLHEREGGGNAAVPESDGWSVRLGVLNWARTALGLAPPPEHAAIDAFQPRNAAPGPTTPSAGPTPLANRRGSPFIVRQAALPAKEQYHHHITRMLLERVPKVEDAVRVLQDAEKCSVELDPHDFHRILEACVDVSQPPDDEAASLVAQCLNHMAVAKVAPEPAVLTTALRLLSSDAVSPGFASDMVRLVTGESNAVAAWPALNDEIVAALLRKAGTNVGDVSFEEVLAMLARPLGSFGKWVAVEMAASKIRQCRQSTPPRSQEVLQMYVAVKDKGDDWVTPAMLEDVMVALCTGPSVCGSDENGAPIALASIALDLLSDALARRSGRQISLSCQEIVLAANVKRTSFAHHGRVPRQILPMAWRHLSSPESLNEPAMHVYRWLVKRLIFEADYEEANNALMAAEAKLRAALEHRAEHSGVDCDSTLSWYSGGTMTDLATLSARWRGRPADTPSPVDRALQIFSLLEQKGPGPNELHFAAAINACATDRPSARVADVIALFKTLQSRTELPQSDSAWYAVLKAFAHTRPHPMTNEALSLLNSMLTHKEYPSPNQKHYKWALLACLRAHPPRVADAATLLVTAPVGTVWNSRGSLFNNVLSAVRTAAHQHETLRRTGVISRDVAAERRRLAKVSVELLARMIRDGIKPSMTNFDCALLGALDGTLASGSDGLAVLRLMVDEGVKPQRSDFTRVLECCGTAEDADDVVALMAQVGHTVFPDDAVHLNVLKAYHRSDPPAWERSVAYLLDLVRNMPQGGQVGPALFQAAMRSCAKAKPAQLAGALRLLELMMEQSTAPNFTTLTLLLQCCRLAEPDNADTAESLWRDLADPSQHDSARFAEACDELRAVVGQAKADVLIADYNSRRID